MVVLVRPMGVGWAAGIASLLAILHVNQFASAGIRHAGGALPRASARVRRTLVGPHMCLLAACSEDQYSIIGLRAEVV